MGWFNQIKKKTESLDDSPELKRGEFKNILLGTMERFFPDFEFLRYKKEYYQFQRTRRSGELNVYESFDFGFSLKEKLCSVSVASRLNPFFIGGSGYNSGLINPHVDLIGLKKNSGIIPLEEAYYFHNGRQKTTNQLVIQIMEDLRNFGLPFLEAQSKNRKTNQLFVEGIKKYKDLTYDKVILKSEIDKQMNESGHVISRVKHPIFLDLKQSLQGIENISREDRKEIPRLAYELIELFVYN